MNSTWLLEESQRNSLLLLYYIWFPGFNWFANVLVLRNALLRRQSAVLPLDLYDLLFYQVHTLEVLVVWGKLIYKQAKFSAFCLVQPRRERWNWQRGCVGSPSLEVFKRQTGKGFFEQKTGVSSSPIYFQISTSVISDTWILSREWRVASCTDSCVSGPQRGVPWQCNGPCWRYMY